MESTIRKIYEKELGYHEKVPDDKEYQKCKQEYNKAYEALEETLSAEQKQLLSELYACEGGVEWELEFLSFKDGFRAGMRLGMELCEEE